jgi:hypothetical protein
MNICQNHEFGRFHINKHGVCRTCNYPIFDVSIVNTKDWLGIKYANGSALIENQTFCCESWGIKIDGKELGEIPNGTVIGTTKGKFKHTGINEIRNQSYVEAEFTAGDLGSCKVWCMHNGYYSHKVEFDFPSHFDSFEL